MNGPNRPEEPRSTVESPLLRRKIQLAVVHHRQGKLAEAKELYEEILKEQPNHASALHLLGVVHAQSHNPVEAERLYRQAIAVNPNVAAVHSNLGVTLQHLTRYTEALTSFDRAIALKPDYAEAHSNRGNALQRLERLEEALASYDRAIELNRAYAQAYYNRGNVLKELGRLDEAVAGYDQAIAIHGEYWEAHGNRGNALHDLKRFEEAVASYDRAIDLKPDYPEAYFNRGNALRELRRLTEAVESYDRAIAQKPDFAVAHSNRGAALADLRRLDEAVAAYDKALAYKADHTESWSNRGNALKDLKRYDEAVASYDQAIALRPDYVTALFNRGNALREMKRLEEAVVSYQRAVALKPDYDFLYGDWVHTKMRVCDWGSVGADIAHLSAEIGHGRKASTPFPILSILDSAALQRKAAEAFVKEQHPAIAATSLPRPPRHDKIRLGYFSADFRAHPGAYLIAGLFETHDRSRFEVNAFSFGPDTGDEMRKRLSAGADRFIDVEGKSDAEIAALARKLEMDIAIDRSGFTGMSRTGIFAVRAAPIQVSFLAYPGTMGADFIDYLIADRTVIPEADRRHYAEKIAYLPDSYQVNDSKRSISDRVFARREMALPETGFVFCCFNNNYKILPDTFDCWMRVLRRVEGSVLWLLQDNEAAARNLRREAEARGVSADRLVFASRIPSPDHLARHRLADLFLDTLPYNAHTTASDALWTGLPVLTQIGTTFAGRVAASLLQAIGLPELIVSTESDYEELAVSLATRPAELAKLRKKLAQNRLAMPLFNTGRFAMHIETAFSMMYSRYRDGLSPDHLSVPASPS